MIRVDDRGNITMKNQNIIYGLRKPEISEDNSIILLSTNPVVDGSNLTTNKDIKFRRKRVVSETHKGTKRVHIKEFLDACRFITGLIKTPCPLSQQHKQLLASIRNNGPIPKNYESAIENNLDLVCNAAQYKPKEIKRIYDRYTEKVEESKVETKKVKHSSDFSQRLEDWVHKRNGEATMTTEIKNEEPKDELKTRQRISKDKLELFKSYLFFRAGLDDCPEIPQKDRKIFMNAISNYRHGRLHYVSKSYRNILNENKELLDKMQFRTLKPRTKATISTYTKQTEDIKIPTTSVTLDTDNNTLIEFVSLAKAAGIKEISIKI